MSRNLILTGLAALFAATAITFVPPAQAQIGTIFSDPPPRPPGSVPRGNQIPDDEEEEVPPELPQGRVLPAPNRLPPGQQGNAMPGAVQSQPLPPPPGSSAAPSNQPVAIAPPIPQAAPQPGAGTNPALPGLPPGQRQPKGTPQGTQAGVPQAPPSILPGDEVVVEPPAQKIVNKKATFSGLDKITGRIINFDEEVGETVQFGALRVKTDACYTRPATEAANTDAFVEVDEITLQGEVKRIFSGWMFAASPGLHGVEHPIYDIWLADCKEPQTTSASAAPDPAARPSGQKKAAAPKKAASKGQPYPQSPPPQQPAPLPPFGGH